MVASARTLFLLSLAAAASAVVPQDFSNALNDMQLDRSLDTRQTSPVAAVNQSIAAMSASLATANNSIVAFDGGIGGLVSLNDNVVALGNQINKTTAVAQSTPLLSPTDSAAVGISFLFLQPNINQLLQNLDAIQPDMDNALYGIIDTRSLIHDTLVIQQGGALNLGNALLNILDPTLKGIAIPINDQIQGNFTASINAWNGRSGTIKIPTDLVPTVTNLLANIGPIISGFLGGNITAELGGILKPRQDSRYCCGITQERLDALGPDENDLTGIPQPLIEAFQATGILPA